MRSAALGWPTLRELAAEGALAAQSKTYGAVIAAILLIAVVAWVAVPRIPNLLQEGLACHLYLGWLRPRAANSRVGTSMEQCGRLTVG
jgi:hypothetical protein